MTVKHKRTASQLSLQAHRKRMRRTTLTKRDKPLTALERKRKAAAREYTKEIALTRRYKR